MGKVISITKHEPRPATLPDGVYSGTWGGYNIEVVYGPHIYHLKTEEGVRGMGIKVMVTIKDGVATYEETKN